MLPSTAHLYTRKLSSVTTNLKAESLLTSSTLGESYTNLIENSFIDADKYPETGFALNIDKASYSNIRRFLSNDMLVPIDAVRIEEMLNYFSFTSYEDKSLSRWFHCRSKLTTCPWNEDNRLLFLNIAAPKTQSRQHPALQSCFPD
jgi:Ca-activated chloride channel family protein